MNPFVRDIFATRAAIIRYIRRFFDERGFLEVRCPTCVRLSLTFQVHLHLVCSLLVLNHAA